MEQNQIQSLLFILKILKGNGEIQPSSPGGLFLERTRSTMLTEPTGLIHASTK